VKTAAVSRKPLNGIMNFVAEPAYRHISKIN
jgi:hypothetical protein